MEKIEGLPSEVPADDPLAVYDWFTDNTHKLPPEEQKAFFESYLEAYPEQGQRVIAQVMWTTHAVLHPEISDDDRAKGLFGCKFEEMNHLLIFATT